MIAARNRRRLWSVLSLWALLALAMPQLLWACPMTGQFGSTPEQACRCIEKDASASTENSSATPSHKCCKHIPLPASDTSGHSDNGLLSQARTFSFAPQSFSVASDLFAAPAFELAPPLAHRFAFPPTISPPLNSQHFPASHSGRAPPF
jgi:hypothetical protein